MYNDFAQERYYCTISNESSYIRGECGGDCGQGGSACDGDCGGGGKTRR